MIDTASSTSEKVRKLNFESPAYGTFAEIGAGQEVAGWFFHVGGAARTVAMSTSAYDMATSDALYGHADRYVSRQRLEAMLEHELAQVTSCLSRDRGATTPFFAFADTVATRRRGKTERGRGWVGIRFQAHPGAPPSQIIVHVHLLDETTVGEQDALGVLGVNLIYGALFLRDDFGVLLGSLMDGLSRRRIEIDMVKVSGPAFAGVDNRLGSLQLVEQRLTDAAMFTASGEVVQPSEVLYRRPVLVERGRFRPATRLTVDLLERARARFLDEPEVRGLEPVVLAEINASKLLTGAIGREDFLARAEILHVLGIDVLISRFQPYYQLTDYLSAYTDRMIGIAVGMPTAREILAPEYESAVSAGALEALGRLFKRSVKMYVYPTRDPITGALLTADLAPVPSPGHLVRDFLLELGRMEPLAGFDASLLSIQTDDVLTRLQNGDRSWEGMVPPAVAARIKEKRLFGLQDDR